MDIASIFHRLTGERSTAPGAPDATESRADFASMLQILRGVLPPRREIAAAEAGTLPGIPAAPLTDNGGPASSVDSASSPGTHAPHAIGSEPRVDSVAAAHQETNEPSDAQPAPDAEALPLLVSAPVVAVLNNDAAAPETVDADEGGASVTSALEVSPQDEQGSATRTSSTAAEPGAAPPGGTVAGAKRTPVARIEAIVEAPSANASAAAETGSASPVQTHALARPADVDRMGPEPSRPPRPNPETPPLIPAGEARAPRTTARPETTESPEPAPTPTRVFAQEPTVSPEPGFSQESDSPENPARHTDANHAPGPSQAGVRPAVVASGIGIAEPGTTTAANPQNGNPPPAVAGTTDVSPDRAKDAPPSLDGRDTRSVLQMGRLRSELGNARVDRSGQSERVRSAASAAPPAVDSVESAPLDASDGETTSVEPTRQLETTHISVESNAPARGISSDDAPKFYGSTAVTNDQRATASRTGERSNDEASLARPPAIASSSETTVAFDDRAQSVSVQAKTHIDHDTPVRPLIASDGVERTDSTTRENAASTSTTAGAAPGEQSARTALSAIVRLLQGDESAEAATSGLRSIARPKDAGDSVASTEVNADKPGIDDPSVRVSTTVESGAPAPAESLSGMDLAADQTAASTPPQADLAPEVGTDRGATRHAAAETRAATTDAPRPGAFGQTMRAAAAWMDAVMTRPAAYHTEANGTSVLRLRIDEEAGAVTLKTRRDGDRMVVHVAFSDPTLQASAQSQGDEIRAALQQLFESAVDLSFAQQDRPQEGHQADAGASAARPVSPEIASAATESEPARSPRYNGLAGARYEWVG